MMLILNNITQFERLKTDRVHSVPSDGSVGSRCVLISELAVIIGSR